MRIYLIAVVRKQILKKYKSYCLKNICEGVQYLKSEALVQQIHNFKKNWQQYLMSF